MTTYTRGQIDNARAKKEDMDRTGAKLAEKVRPRLLASASTSAESSCPMAACCTCVSQTHQIATFRFVNVLWCAEVMAVKLGLGNWDLMERAGIKLADLVQVRNAPYHGTDIEQLPNLTEEQKRLIKTELTTLVGPAEAETDISFSPATPQAEAVGFLWQRADLVTISLALPRSQHISLASRINVEKRVARTWNRYSYLLMRLADILEIAPGVAAAVLAGETDQRGFTSDGRMIIRFENQVFFDKWGNQHPEMFQQHFRFDPSRPWEKHQWRPSADGAWRDCHGTQRDEWEVFEFACTLDETAAKLSIGMGRPKMMGFNAFSSGERYHLLGFFDLISGPSASSRRLKALQDQDFDAFAALHYGSRQAARYGSTLRSLFEALQLL